MFLTTCGGTQICIVKGGKGDGEVVFWINPDNKDDKKLIEKHCKKILEQNVRTMKVWDGKFEQLPSDKVRILYIAGPSGSGKSTYLANYVRWYQKLFPNCKVILFSKIDDDIAFEDLDCKRIELSEDLIENPLDISEVEPGSIVIFDDVDTIANKKLLASLMNFQSQILELGRHGKVQCIITSHLINKGPQTRTIMSEMKSFTFFPSSGTVQPIEYALKRYIGLRPDEIRDILSIDSRWVTLLLEAPQMILTEHECTFLSEFKKKIKSPKR